MSQPSADTILAKVETSDILINLCGLLEEDRLSILGVVERVV